MNTAAPEDVSHGRTRRLEPEDTCLHSSHVGWWKGHQHLDARVQHWQARMA